MDKLIGIFVAWPYGNGELHLGHIAGAYLPADIFARYHRLRDDGVLVVSGTDSHGTPITIRAEQEGVTPKELFERYHRRFLTCWQQLGISFDLYTHTDTENHKMIAQEIFTRLLEKNFLFRRGATQQYCEKDKLFLPDRYIEGTCPRCGSAGARGDQCETCGNLLDATEVLNARCRLCGEPPVLRQTEHFFLDLPAFRDKLYEWAVRQTHWRRNVYQFTLNYITSIAARPVTRDLEWGIPIPLDGYEGKRIYVWFEAVIGYLSASIEWARYAGQDTAWEKWWRREEARGYYFVGKDNIPFHTIIWPTILLGYCELNLPYDVPANEFLNLEGEKFSTSRNWAVWAIDFVLRHDPDTLRYYLTVIAPETQDSSFSWVDFQRRVNADLVGNWGNLVHRVLTFCSQHFGGKVPTPGELSVRDQEILEKVRETFGKVGSLVEECRFKAALTEIMKVASELNRYLTETAPWNEVKRSDKTRAATALFVSLRAIDSLKTLLLPFLPFSSQKVHWFLGYSDDLIGSQEIVTLGEVNDRHEVLVNRYTLRGEDQWRPSALSPGWELRQSVPLFARVEDEVIAGELNRLRGVEPRTSSKGVRQ